MTYVDAFILGIVEGITEFLPISSTGHLILADVVLRLPNTEFLKSFEIAIQFGAICSVLALYWRKVSRNFEYMKKIAVACLPTFAVGALVYPYVKGYLLGNTAVVVGALFLGGIGMIAFERWYKKRERATEARPLTYGKAFLIGCAQSVAIIPGVSRSAATILGGLGLGMKREDIVEFSFLIAAPTLAAATGYDLLKTGASFGEGGYALLAVGAIVAGITAYASMRWLIRYIQTHSFVPFGVYRIILAAAAFLLLFA